MDFSSDRLNGLRQRFYSGVDGHLKKLCKTGHLKDAISLLDSLNRHDIQASHETYICLLQECINTRAFPEGKLVHANMMKNGFVLDMFLGNILIKMYAKCGKVTDSRPVFEKMHDRNILTWTMMIGGYAKLGNAEEAFKLFWQMESEKLKPNKITFLSILRACTTLEHGKQVHAYIIQSGLESDSFLRSNLIDMYAKCGNLGYARQVFDQMPERDVIVWNSMIAGYAQHGHSNEALILFLQMQLEGVEADEVTFSSIIKACVSLGALKQGKQIHCHVTRSTTNSTLVTENALIDMYAKCGNFENAIGVFLEMAQRDVISWTAMIAGCAQHGHFEQAFKLFWQMQKGGVSPDQIAYVSVLKACASMGALELGQEIHAHSIMCGFELRMLLGNTLVDMYAKCGTMESAHRVFKLMPKRDPISWTAMISGYAQHGSATEALQLVEQMRYEGMKLDHIGFVGVLCACSHSGLVDEGYHCFDFMSHIHSITPTAEHYTCMVDLHCRAGRLEEAMQVIGEIPFQPGAEIWITLLAACRSYGELKLAEHAAECILKLQPQNTAAFVLLSNIHADAGRWEDKARVRKLMEETNVQ